MKVKPKINKVLVLNSNWQPIGFFGLQKSMNLIIRNRAKIIHHNDFVAYTWDDWSKLKAEAGDNTIKSTVKEFKLPEIILLINYSKLPPRKQGLSRRSLYDRDKNTCQYCNKKFHPSELSIDHIIPRSRGGKTTWTNAVIACTYCNSKKGNKTLEEAKMKLIREPKEPKFSPLFNALNITMIDSWQKLLDQTYWCIPLD